MNNAGRLRELRIHKATRADYRAVFEVNVFGVAMVIKVVTLSSMVQNTNTTLLREPLG